MTTPRVLAIEVFHGLSIQGFAPGGYVGNSYSATLQAINGIDPFTWSVSGSLPPSMSFSGSGASATITSASITSSDVGAWPVVINLRDNTRTRVQRTLTINVVALPLVITNSFASYTAGVAQSFDYTTSGGASGAKTFAVTSGSLPPGLSLSSAGHISGNTTGLSVGTHSYTFTVTATDLASATASVSQTLTVTVVSISVTNSAPAGTQGVSYSFTYTKSGGTGAVTWTKQSGTLPPGLTLSSAGVLSGTPTSGGTYAYVVAVADNAGTVATHSESVSIAYATLTMTGSAPTGEVGIAYSFTPTISGGNGSNTVTVSSGSLPSWASLNSTTGAVTGTPTTAASTTFTLHCASGDGQTVNLSVTVLINAALALSGTAPTPKNVGDSFSWTPTTTGGVGTIVYSIGSGSIPAGCSLNTSTGAITGTLTTAATYTFVVHAVDSLGASANTATQTVVVAVYVPATWNPSDKSTGVTLSSGNTVAGGTNNSGAGRANRAIHSASYWETIYNSSGYAYFNQSGISKLTWDVNVDNAGYLGSGSGATKSASGPQSIQGDCYYNNVKVATLTPISGTGGRVGHAFDPSTGTYKITINGSTWTTIATGLTGDWYPTFEFHDNTQTQTGVFDPASLAWSPPAGHAAGVN